MHISEIISQMLLSAGWQETAPGNFRCVIPSFAPAGTISDGTRIVQLTVCERGRYLSRVDGWGFVQKDVDLRDFANRPVDAIAAVLGE